MLFRNALLEMIADLQSERMDEQRAMLPGLVNRRGVPSNVSNIQTNTPAPDDAFLDMLIRCQVRSSIVIYYIAACCSTYII